eukprot:scaffold184_cov179-Amphora_coffeaeformis.AAC.7
MDVRTAQVDVFDKKAEYWDCWNVEFWFLVGSTGILLGIFYLRRSSVREQQQHQRRRIFELSHSHSNLDTSENSFARTRSFSWDAFPSLRASNPRPRGPSFDFGFMQTMGTASDEKLKEWMSTPQNAATTSSGNSVTATEITPNKYYGPCVQMIQYETWTPPPTWAEMARRLVPAEVPTLQRTLQIQFANESTFSVIVPLETKDDFETDFSISVDSISIHPKSPDSVLDVYVKESPRSEWMEHTFATTREAAQFQLDLLAVQIFGKQVYHMYQALEIVHRGSMAFAGVETVIHDTRLPPTDNRQGGGSTGIAWDDVMRSLGLNFPIMRWRLEHMWWAEMSGMMERSSDGNEVDSDENVELVSEYQKKRLLLGLVDLFRLFVPQLPEGSIPETRPTSERFTRLLRLRKRVARASLLVQNYYRAKVIANTGWKLNLALPNGYWTKRLAYDETMDNILRDSTAENEFYEPTVSRDLHCLVRGQDFNEHNTTAFVRSKGQAFMLVDAHLLQCGEESGGNTFDFASDPIESLASLRSLVKGNESSDFFVLTLRTQDDLAAVYVFVRSLAKGVDDAFDESWSNFCESDVETRNSKLECMFNLSIPPRGLTVLSRLFWRFFSGTLRCAQGGNVPQVDVSTPDNYSIGSCRLSLLGNLRHFGGCLQSNPSLPRNYAATKLPERALATVRHVRLSSSLKPILFHPIAIDSKREGQTEGRVVWKGLLTGQFTDDAVSSITSIGYPNDHPYPNDVPQPLAAIIATADPIEKGVNQVIELLDDIRVPVKEASTEIKHQPGHDFFLSTNLPCPPSAETALRNRNDLRQVPVLGRVSRADIRRFYIASGLNIKASAVRVVDSAAWRGLTFPVDTRVCRVELQNGQFFQQGRDLSGHPIFYFRSMCRGPWRGDEDAVVSSILHRLETSLECLSASNLHVRCTFIIVLGRPIDTGINLTRIGHRDGEQGELDASAPSQLHGDRNSVRNKTLSDVGNARITPSEPWQVHATTRLLHRLIDLLLYHYPERLHRALIVTKDSSKLGLTNANFARHLKGRGIRDRVTILRKYQGLTAFVHASELVNFVGGTATVDKKTFDA